MSDSLRPIVFTVRNRPVGYQPGKWGGALIAVERGFFPISGTGYRSITGFYGLHGDDAAASITPEFLAELAANQDRVRRTALAAVQRPPVAGPNPLSNYVTVSSDAASALDEGFFAPDAERLPLWAGAFRLLSLIDTDARFQPMPSGPGVWTPEHCADALARNRESLAFLRQLARGDLPAAPLRRHLSASAYFALPPRPGGEPVVMLPAISGEFALDLPAPSAHVAAPRTPTSPKSAPPDDGDEAEQMPLL